jgi:restriction system protein
MEYGNPEFKEFHRPSHQVEGQAETCDEVSLTPREVMEAGYLELRRGLSQELLERIKSCSPRFFERLVVDLLVAMGYGGSPKEAGEAVGQSGDGGVDGIIREDKLGLDAIYIQAKKWEGTVGRPVVQAFAGSLEGQRARKGVLITTSQFFQDARDYVTRIEKKIVLIEGDELTRLMIDHGVGVAEDASYVIKRLDIDYFDEDI